MKYRFEVSFGTLSINNRRDRRTKMVNDWFLVAVNVLSMPWGHFQALSRSMQKIWRADGTGLAAHGTCYLYYMSKKYWPTTTSLTTSWTYSISAFHLASICPGSADQFYIVSYFMKWVTTSCICLLKIKIWIWK